MIRQWSKIMEGKILTLYWAIQLLLTVVLWLVLCDQLAAM